MTDVLTEDPYAQYQGITSLEAPTETTPDLTCPECGGGPYKSARGLSKHYTQAHGGGAEGVSLSRQVQRDTAGGRGAPNTEQLTKGLSRLLGYGSTIGADLITESDPRARSWTDEEHDATIEALSLTKTEAEDITRPLARAFSKTTMNKRYGRQVLNNLDVADSILALLMLGRRWQSYVKERDRYIALGQQADGIISGVAPLPNATPPQSAPMTNGVVVTPDMIAEMQRRKAQ